MASITATAKEFFDACETGKGWEGCKTYCNADATFSAQAEPLAEVKTLAQYTDWMKGLFGPLPNGSYEVKSFATDAERNNVTAYGVFSGTHPVGVLRQRLDLGERLGLRGKSCVGGTIGLAALPTFPRLAGVKELLGSRGD